jgi:hypothetical protein
MVFHSTLPGIHFTSKLGGLPQLALVLVAAVTLLTFVMVGTSRWRGWTAVDVLPVTSVLILWSLLAVYHRNYDSLVVIAFMVFCLSVIATWQLPAIQRKSLGLFYLFVLFVMCLPGDLLRNFLPESQVESALFGIDWAITVAIVAMLAVNLWLLPRTPRLSMTPDSG